ncbi:MAG: hypothetical protein RL326_1572 [Pseudomonadota bacterium]
MWRDRRTQQGMTSLLFLLALIPVLLVMLAVTLEFSHLVGVRDDMQNIVDEEGYDALTYRRSSAEVEERLRTRLADRSDVSFSGVTVESVTSTVSAAAASVSASVDYKGTFLSFLENFMGRESQVLELSATTRMRRQRGGVLLVLDRSALAATDTCAEVGLEARASFIDRVVGGVAANPDNIVRVGVFPGVVESVDLLSLSGDDGIDRCRPILAESAYDTSALRAHIGMPGDPFDVAEDLARIVSDELLARPLEYRAVVLVIGVDSYQLGYSSYAQLAVSAVAEAAELPLQFLIVVAGADGTFTPLPPAYGLYGGVAREVGASLSELKRERFATAVSRAMTERIVWER